MKKLSLLFSSLMLVSLVSCNNGPKETLDPDYEINFDKNTHLKAGEITSRIGVHFHFDEKTVEEKSKDGFITLGPFGGIYLQNYIPGITEVYVNAIYDGGLYDEGGYIVASGSSPNSVEHYSFTQTYTRLTVTLDKPYISIFNRGNKDLIIENLKFKYQEDLSEKTLHDLIQVSDQEAKLDLENGVKPYELNPIDESKIPSNRIVKKIGPEVYTTPGEYIYGYEVHNNLGDGEVGKLLYSSTATFKVKGTTNNKHAAIFHLEDKDVVLEVNDGGKVDISANKEIASYNWDNKLNDFETTFTSDRHFYPTFNVVGVPTNKDGDGCHIVRTTYSLLDGKVNMPDPIMKDGYRFGGWFLDHDCTEVFDMDARHKGNITLYAKCLETSKLFRKVYYYDFDEQILNKIDYLEEVEGAELTLPTFADIGTRLKEIAEPYLTKAYEVRIGANRVKVLRPEGEYPCVEGTYQGDKLTYEMIHNDEESYGGDIKLYVIRLEVYAYPTANVLRFFKDLEENTVMSGLAQAEYKVGESWTNDKILSARYIDADPDYHFSYNTYYDPVRCDTYNVTDEVNGYIIDGVLFTSISSHGYGNKYKEHSKPLQGILRHDSVVRVNRRAFFNRYGLVGTYFPRNAREFDLEAYANTHFNGSLMLPKALNKIGKRCFVGSTNIHNVFLPVSLDKIEKDAFSIAEYDEKKNEFKNMRYRKDDEKIVFYYEGTEQEFNRLDAKTLLEIRNNASKIIYEVKYNPCYSK